jgi:hypothetical protein
MKAFQFYTAPIDPLYQQCMDQLKGKLPSSIEYRFYDTLPYKIDLKGRAGSDIIRFMLLRDNPNSVWIDADTQLKNWWAPPNNDKIYTDKTFSILFDNGQTSIMKAIVDAYNSKTFPHKIGWMQKLLSTTYADKLALIPPGYFNHLDLAITQNNKGYAWIGNGKFSVRKINGIPTLTVY